MDTFKDADIIDLIKKDKRNEAYKLLKRRHKNECFHLISSISWDLDKHDIQTIYDEYYILFCNKVVEDKFEFRSDNAFLSYFKDGCVNQTHSHLNKRKSYKKTFILNPEILRYFKDEVDVELENSTNDFLNEKERLSGVKISFDDDGEAEKQNMFDKVMRIYHTLSEKCKIIIELFVFQNLTHKEIAEMLGYASERVSITRYSVCREQFRMRFID